MDDLDGEMPGVAWDLLPMKQYRAHNWHCFEHITERSPVRISAVPVIPGSTDSDFSPDFNVLRSARINAR